MAHRRAGSPTTTPRHVSYSSVGRERSVDSTRPCPTSNGLIRWCAPCGSLLRGSMSAAGGGGPSFTIQFRVRIGLDRPRLVAPDRSDFGADAPILGCHFPDRLSDGDLRGLTTIFSAGRVGTQIALSRSSAECSPPPRETFCWTERVQERKGLHAFFMLGKRCPVSQQWG